jgi:hypothetical protein
MLSALTRRRAQPCCHHDVWQSSSIILWEVRLPHAVVMKAGGWLHTLNTILLWLTVLRLLDYCIFAFNFGDGVLFGCAVGSQLACCRVSSSQVSCRAACCASGALEHNTLCIVQHHAAGT